MPRQLALLPVPAGQAALDIVPALRAALAGTGPALLPHAADGPAPSVPAYDDADLPDDLALAVGTSGSTGAPKLALLTAPALAASAAATARRLGGPGDWLLALPAHHIAGLQVLLRAAADDGRVRALPSGAFTASAFAQATAGLSETGEGRPTYVSLVPTQLGRLLQDEEGTAAARTYAAILVGGAACPPPLLAAATRAGVRVVTTYGGSETCGGCVYDGEPLDCADMELDADGRVLLGGSMLAAGYLGDPTRTAEAFPLVAGRRRFRTDDLGRLELAESGARLHILGRADDVIVTGGMKVLPGSIEQVLRARLGPGWDVCVLGVPDPEWGESVAVALAAPGGQAPTVDDVRRMLRGALPAYALPRRVLDLPALPTLAIGKVDREGLRRLFEAEADRMGPDQADG